MKYPNLTAVSKRSDFVIVDARSAITMQSTFPRSMNSEISEPDKEIVPYPITWPNIKHCVEYN